MDGDLTRSAEQLQRQRRELLGLGERLRKLQQDLDRTQRKLPGQTNQNVKERR
jgi:hypothetical protein